LIGKRQKEKLPRLPAGASAKNYSAQNLALAGKPQTPANAKTAPKPTSAGAKQPPTTPKNTLAEKVASKVLSKPLAVDKDKQDFAKRQTSATEQLLKHKITTINKIEQHEETSKTF